MTVSKCALCVSKVFSELQCPAVPPQASTRPWSSVTMTKHATWAKVRCPIGFPLQPLWSPPSCYLSLMSFQHHFIFCCLYQSPPSWFPFPPSFFSLLGVKRAVKYVNEFLAPALCNQVNKVWNNRITFLQIGVHSSMTNGFAFWKLTSTGTKRCSQISKERKMSKRTIIDG